MANLSSNDLKKVGQKYEVNGEEAKRVAPVLWVEEVNFF